MKRLNATDEKIMHTMEKFDALLNEFNTSSNGTFKGFVNSLNQFKQDLILLKELNKISSSLSINDDKFEDIDNEISNALDDMIEQHQNIKQGLTTIKEKLLIVREIK